MTHLTTKTAKRLKEIYEVSNELGLIIMGAEEIISFKNELKEIIGTQCDCLPCHRFRNLIQEIESVEQSSDSNREG